MSACVRVCVHQNSRGTRRQAKTRVTSGLFEERQRVCIFHNSLAEALRGPMPSGSVSSRATKGGSGVFPLFLVPCPLLEWSAHKQRPLKLLPSRERSFLSPSTRFFHSSLSPPRERLGSRVVYAFFEHLALPRLIQLWGRAIKKYIHGKQIHVHIVFLEGER